MKKTSIIALVVTTYICFSATATAAKAPVFTPEQEARIGEIAGDYLLAHPEILVQVSQKLQVQQREKRQQVYAMKVMDNLKPLTADPDTPVIGPADARVAVIEFFDYQCVHCSNLAPTIEKVMKQRADVQYIFKEWPIFGGRWENSALAANRGLAIWKAAGAEAYLEYHNGIYRTEHIEGNLTAFDIEKATKPALLSAVKTKDMSAALERNDSLAQALGLTGTPGLIVLPLKNVTPAKITVIPGAVGAEQLMAAIDKAGR